MKLTDYQVGLSFQLASFFSQVVSEWRAFKYGVQHQYAPRVDIAIGPFNDEDSSENLSDYYGQLVNDEPLRGFLEDALSFHVENLRKTIYSQVRYQSFLELIERNRNARCLIAIEIENRNSRKHLMGSIVNAAALGRVGIGIGFTEKSLRTFLRVVNYLSFLKNVDKNGYDTCNFLVLSVDQVEELLQRLASNTANTGSRQEYRRLGVNRPLV